MTSNVFVKLKLVDTYSFTAGYIIEVRKHEDGTFWAGRRIAKKIVSVIQVQKCANGGYETMSQRSND